MSLWRSFDKLKAAGLFSGGKDSLYAVYLAERQGVTVEHLISLVPSLPWPSPHGENMEALKILARSMGRNHIIVDYQGMENFVEALKGLEVDALVAGDILVEAHLTFLQDVCNKVGLKLLEPIYGRDTSELFHEIFGLEFKALITGVDLKFLGVEWLGFTISKETAATFLSKIGSVDPLGENGEFHTLVLECPLYAKSFKVKSAERKVAKGMAYLNVSIV
ncbi:MAG: diphthine--ammonia ligase [Candidatus Bathyarchaeum sp.]|nr:MAG: diphthine--ammonia ligase [Candidatus Bathyarchaeum sp.]